MPKPRVITENEDFPIKPSDINASEYMWDAYGNVETDISAGYIIRLLQEKGDWLRFTYGELNAYYKKTCTPSKGGCLGNYTFNRLLGEFHVLSIRGDYSDRLDVVVREGGEKNHGYDIKDTDVFLVTDQFIFRAYSSRPMPRMKPVPHEVVTQ